MSDEPQGVDPQTALAPQPPKEEESSGRSATRVMMIVIGAFAGILVLGFVAALILALFDPGAAQGVQIVRDFFIIAMALEGLLIGGALVVLVLQLARLTNLLQNEIKPILDQTSDTVKTVKGTATFMSRNVADPVIRAGGVLAWLLAVVRELFGVRRAVARRPHEAEPEEVERG
jgi:hypothetical protein